MDTFIASTGDVDEPAVDTAAVVTYPAHTGGCHVVAGIAYSFSATPTGGNIKVEDGSGNKVFTVGVPAAGENYIAFRPALKGTKNTAMIVTATVTGGTSTAKLSVMGHWVESTG